MYTTIVWELHTLGKIQLVCLQKLGIIFIITEYSFTNASVTAIQYLASVTSGSGFNFHLCSMMYNDYS